MSNQSITPHAEAVVPFFGLSEPFDPDRPLWIGRNNPQAPLNRTAAGYGLLVAFGNEEHDRNVAILTRQAVAKALLDVANENWRKMPAFVRERLRVRASEIMRGKP